MNNRSIQAFILAGGKSSRMGRDKGLVELREGHLIERVLRSVKGVGLNGTIVSANHHYDVFGLPRIEDEYLEKGPMSGIYTGLKHSQSEFNLFLSCDMPFISVEMLTYLINAIVVNVKAIVPLHHNQLEPLCAIYHKSVLPEVKQQLEQNKLGLIKWLAEINAMELSVEAQPFYHSRLFMNVNTVQDLNELKVLMVNGN